MPRPERKEVPLKTECQVCLSKTLLDFVSELWATIGLPKLTREQIWIVCLLDSTSVNPDGVNLGDIKRLILLAFRGVAKTYLTAAYVVWKISHYPYRKFLIISASLNKAYEITSFMRNIIESMKDLQWLIPEPNENLAWGNAAFAVRPTKGLAVAPTVTCAGVGTQITGKRADEIIGDDIEIPSNSDTEDKREKLVSVYREFISILIPENNPRIVLLGTPQSFNSVYTNKLSSQFTTSVITAEYPNLQEVGSYNGNLYPAIVTDLLNGTRKPGDAVSIRFPFDKLLEIKSNLGQSSYQLQFMLDTTMTDKYKFPLRMKDLCVFDCDDSIAPITIAWGMNQDNKLNNVPNVGMNGDGLYRPMMVNTKELVQYEIKRAFIDPSGMGKDRLASVVVAKLGAKLFWLRHDSLEGGYTDSNMLYLAQQYKELGVSEVYIESNFGGGMFRSLFEGVLRAINHGCLCVDIRNSKQKEVRIIDTLEPVLNKHRLVVNTKIIEDCMKSEMGDQINYNVLYQLTHISRSRGALIHDDSIDALAGCIATYTDDMVINEQDEIDKIRAGEFSRMMDELTEISKSPQNYSYWDRQVALGRTSNLPKAWQEEQDVIDKQGRQPYERSKKLFTCNEFESPNNKDASDWE